MAISIILQKPKSWSKKRVHADTKPDADNFAKLVCDCLEGLVYTNDSRIVSLSVHKRLGESPCVLVYVDEMEEENVGQRKLKSKIGSSEIATGAKQN